MTQALMSQADPPEHGKSAVGHGPRADPEVADVVRATRAGGDDHVVERPPRSTDAHGTSLATTTGSRPLTSVNKAYRLYVNES